VSSFLTERDNILVEELCDSINVAFDEADRSEIEFDIGHAQPPRYIWEEVAERANRVGHAAVFDGQTLTVTRRSKGPA
jgi:hypothetical protein